MGDTEGSIAEEPSLTSILLQNLQAAVDTFLAQRDHESIQYVVAIVLCLLQDGLVGNRVIAASIWDIITAIGRAFPLLLHSQIDKAYNAANGREEEAITLWIRQTLHTGALSSCLERVETQPQILSAYSSEAFMRQPYAVAEAAKLVQNLQGIIGMPDMPIHSAATRQTSVCKDVGQSALDKQLVNLHADPASQGSAVTSSSSGGGASSLDMSNIKKTFKNGTAGLVAAMPATGQAVVEAANAALHKSKAALNSVSLPQWARGSQEQQTGPRSSSSRVRVEIQALSDPDDSVTEEVVALRLLCISPTGSSGGAPTLGRRASQELGSPEGAPARANSRSLSEQPATVDEATSSTSISGGGRSGFAGLSSWVSEAATKTISLMPAVTSWKLSSSYASSGSNAENISKAGGLSNSTDVGRGGPLPTQQGARDKGGGAASGVSNMAPLTSNLVLHGHAPKERNIIELLDTQWDHGRAVELPEVSVGSHGEADICMDSEYEEMLADVRAVLSGAYEYGRKGWSQPSSPPPVLGPTVEGVKGLGVRQILVEELTSEAKAGFVKFVIQLDDGSKAQVQKRQDELGELVPVLRALLPSPPLLSTAHTEDQNTAVEVPAAHHSQLLNLLGLHAQVLPNGLLAWVPPADCHSENAGVLHPPPPHSNSASSYESSSTSTPSLVQHSFSSNSSVEPTTRIPAGLSSLPSQRPLQTVTSTGLTPVRTTPHGSSTSHRKAAPPSSTLRLQVQPLPILPDNEQFERQAGMCPGCEEPLMHPSKASRIWGNGPRRCHYTSRLYCHKCHTGQTSPLPAQVLGSWDLRSYPVCASAQQYLNSISTHPLLCVSAINPGLYNKVPDLCRAHDLRCEFVRLSSQSQLAAHPKMQAIKLSAGSRRYLLEASDFWSMLDLLDISKGKSSHVLRFLEKALEAGQSILPDP